jgi:uncharacterized protein YfiM (DUF2279 family)
MKNILFCILFSFNLLGQSITIPEDKLLHLGGSYLLASTTTQFAQYKGATPKQAFWIGFGVSISAGIIKELYDNHYRATNWKDTRGDLGADLIGSYLGAFTTITIRF